MDTILLERSPIATTAIFTHPGLDPEKQVNEDVAACVETPVGLLCVVCDGMGGHANGKEAAETAVTVIVSTMKKRERDDDPRLALEAAVKLASSRVYALSEHRKVRAGATCVAVLVHDRGTEVAHVGDSRVHLIHQGTIAVITRDHSKVRAMVDAGMLTPEEAKVHPDANQITRALGIAETVEVEMRPAPVPHMAGDVYVLCTDGLSDLVTPEEMLEHVMRMEEPQAAETLVGVALSRGGHDNTTVAIVRVSRDASLPAAGRTRVATEPEISAESARAGGTVPAMAAIPAMPVIPASNPITQRPPPSTVGEEPAPSTERAIRQTADGTRPSRASLWIGLLLAIFAVGILVALYVVVEKKKRVFVPVPGALPSMTTAPADSLVPTTE